MSDTTTPTTQVPESVSIEVSLSEFLNVQKALAFAVGMLGADALIPLTERLADQTEAIRDEHGIERLQEVTDRQFQEERAAGEERMAEVRSEQEYALAEQGREVAQTAGI